MRRFASVFARRDKEKDTLKRANSTLAPIHTLSPVPPSIPSTPVLSTGSSDPTSSTSSTGSASLNLSLQTPEDEPVSEPTPTPKSKSWTNWLSKRSSTIKRSKLPPDDVWSHPVPPWPSNMSAPVLSNPPAQRSRADKHIDPEEVEDEDSESEEDHPAPTVHTRTPTISPASAARSRKTLEIIIQNSLVPTAASSPFAHVPGAPTYPRSCNPHSSLPARVSMQTTMHKMHLLRRLTEPDVSTLSPIHDRSISSLASRPSPAPVDPPSSLPWYNISVVSVSMGITAISPGLRRWISRPCFEEKFVVHVPLDGSIVSRAVPGSSFGVPELEFSGAIDAMAGLLVDERDLSVISASSDVSPVLRSTSLKPQLQVETTEQKVTPPVKPTTSSPTLSVPATSSPSSPIPSSLISPSSKPAASKSPTTTSRVRFMVEDKDDVVPLGYTIRVKQRREEKARFLREEQERRAFEEEKARQEEERRKREQQRRQWEEEKKAWDKEQRAMEEERKLRIYAEEVAATRLRREQQRAGFPGGASKPTSSNLLAASNSSSSLRSERKRQDPSPVSRPAYDTSRRQASEPTGALHPHTPSASPHTSSPSSSRPASIASRGRGSSRPPSVHTNSSDDQRPSNPRRGSVTSLSVKNVSAFDRSSWSANNPSLMMMPSMPNPMYTMDMPLLPPTPPFMLHQYPAPRSHNSSPARSSSSSQSRQRLPSNSSSQSRQSLHRPPPAQGGPSHQRRSSDDARRMSTPPTRDSQLYGGSLRSHSSTSLARGRSSLPLQELHQQSHPPSPWPGTAPPMATSYSQQQLAPAGRPVHRSTRRQTTIS